MRGLKETYQADPYTVMWQSRVPNQEPRKVSLVSLDTASLVQQNMVSLQPILVKKNISVVQLDKPEEIKPKPDPEADKIFSDRWTPPDHDQIKAATDVYYAKLRTPSYIWTDVEEYYTTYYQRIPYGLESVLKQDQILDRLPVLEPVTEWKWLEKMGLREP